PSTSAFSSGSIFLSKDSSPFVPASVHCHPRESGGPRGVTYGCPGRPTFAGVTPKVTLPQLLPVRNPDVLHLDGVAQQDGAFGGGGIVPVRGEAVVDERALEVADGEPLGRRRRRLRAEHPERVDVVVLSQGLGQRLARTGDDVDDAGGHIGRL